MRALIAAGAVLALGFSIWVWAAGGEAIVQAWAMEGQREAQTAMAGGLRALRAGQPAALSGLLAVCFAYGFFHAVGPGHGKLLIGGYGAARQVGAVRLSVVAVASSLAQGATAVLLVGIGVWVAGWTRERMTDLADRLFAPLSFVVIALVGIWLVWRGARGLLRLRAAAAHEDHVHHHPHDHAPDDATCATCGHAHAPSPEALAQATGWRDIVLLIGAVAIRPCTGALFLLILTAGAGIFWVGILGTIAMALGTAAVTVAVAVAAVTLRGGLLAAAADNATLRLAHPVLELTVGLAVAWIAGSLAMAALPA